MPFSFIRIAALVWICWQVTSSVSGWSACAADDAGGPRFLFTSQGRTGLAAAGSGDVRYLDFDAPHQATWQPGDCFPDGRRLLVLSMEPRRDGPGRPFDEYYTQTPTHIWLHDLADGSLREICNRPRPAVFATPALLLNDDRLLVQVVRDRVGQVLSMQLDGSEAREFTRAGEGLPYGFSLSPDRQRVAFHLAGPAGYQVWTSDLAGGDRRLVAADPEHLFFGTAWSPDGRWIAYVDCRYQQDPGHDWADVCVGSPAGGGHRVLTSGGAMWFAATYGDPATRGGGSNLPSWTKDGAILFPRRSPEARVPWEYQAGRADVDHFNREYRPQQARGGTQVCRLDPRDGSITELTASEPGRWDFRASQSPDGTCIVFCRAATGGSPEIWVMDSDGARPRRVTRGHEDRGADHPRWVPMPARPTG